MPTYYVNNTIGTDAIVGIIADLHHDQQTDEISTNLSELITMYYNESAVVNYLGLGDIIDTSAGDSGPFIDNITDLITAFQGKTIKSVTGNHDMSGATDFYTLGSGIYPADYFTWDIGTKWKIIALSANDNPGYNITQAKLTWLTNQLSTAVSDGRYVIIATHQRLWDDITVRPEVLTPAAVSGNGVTVTSDTADTFAAGDVGKVLFLRHGTCDDYSCWGRGTIASFVSGTEITVNITTEFQDTNAADEWGYLYEEHTIYNSAVVRTIIEAAGASVVKLCLNGHSHSDLSATVNEIEYRQIESLSVSNGETAKTGAILYLYPDGTWKLQGSAAQESYNWNQYYVNSLIGSSTASGRMRYNPKQTLAQIEAISGTASGDVIYVAPGTYYGAVTISQTGATWNFEDDAIVTGFADASGIGDAWSAGVDANGWYTKTGVTTQVYALTEDDLLLSEGVFSAAAVAGSWDWDSNVLYYLPTTGAPGSHTVNINQVYYGITCQAAAENITINNATITGFNYGILLNSSATVNIVGGRAYHNANGVLLNGMSEQCNIYYMLIYNNHGRGIFSSGSHSAASVINYCIFYKNGLTCQSPNDSGAGIGFWNGSFQPIVNNCVFAYNHNGLRIYIQADKTNLPTISNIITYGNVYRGVNVNGTANPSVIFQYAVINDTATWGNSVHSTGISTADPNFIDPLNYNFKLLPDSPCRDTATDVGLTTDFEGKPVQMGSAPDIGAYEFPVPSPMGLTPGLGLGGKIPPLRRRR